MAVHFTPEELTGRRAAASRAMAARGLDGLLMFRQESMYYLTGYDTFGYVFFQCLYLGADGRLMLLTRAPDLLQARHTSVIDDIRVWVDGPEAQPAVEPEPVTPAQRRAVVPGERPARRTLWRLPGREKREGWRRRAVGGWRL